MDILNENVDEINIEFNKLKKRDINNNIIVKGINYETKQVEKKYNFNTEKISS